MGLRPPCSRELHAAVACPTKQLYLLPGLVALMGGSVGCAVNNKQPIFSIFFQTAKGPMNFEKEEGVCLMYSVLHINSFDRWVMNRMVFT